MQERNLGIDSSDMYIWLRTCYAPGTDDLHREMLASLPMDVDGVTDGLGDECLLSDQTLYDFGDDWTRIFRRIPGIVKGTLKDDWLNRRTALVRQFRENPDERDLSYVHYGFAKTFLFVEDAEAFRTGSLLVVWLDDCGRVVRQGRIPADEAHDITALMTKGAVDDCCQAWIEGEIGEAYRDGRLPYGLDLDMSYSHGEPPVLPTFEGLELKD